MKFLRFVLIAFLSMLAVPTSAADAPRLLANRASDQAPQLLILGTVHLHNPARDAVNVTVENVLTEKRQAEIAAVVDQLAAFKPTHVAVEQITEKQADLDVLYADYVAGKRSLERREAEQIGMRLAAQIKLPKVYAVDWNSMPPGPFEAYDFSAFARTHGLDPYLAASFERARLLIPALGARSIGSWLLDINKSDTLLALHRTYFDLSMVGDDKDQPGAAWVGTWYARNLRIFRNLVNLNAKSTDRIVTIFGSGHAYLLRQIARDSGAFRVVDVDAVLTFK
ncbi:MAG: hypothetical protein K1X51_13715 [Rhodospirillaceae bacterium]|nr:hypothetical protein [Rhodospirillaceae bacterium]